MKKKLTRYLATCLSIILCLQMFDLGIAFAANAPDPTAGINLIVPEELQDGNNYFFIRESGQMISEKSTDKV